MTAQSVFDSLLNIFKNCSQFAKWLFTPIKFSYLSNSISFTPIAVFGIGTFITIFTFHVIHLINPLG